MVVDEEIRVSIKIKKLMGIARTKSIGLWQFLVGVSE
jgi:hypothetical protein